MFFCINIYQINPKYRKKKKTVKKANHKHDWKCYLIKNDIEEEPFKTSNMALLSRNINVLFVEVRIIIFLLIWKSIKNLLRTLLL